MSEVNNPFKQQINSQNYYYKILIVNTANQAKYLTQQAVKRIEIIEDLLGTFSYGSIVVNNMLEFIESNFEEESEAVNNASDRFILLGDSNDILRVEIYPLFTDEKYDIDNRNSDSLFKIIYDFAIYDCEDIVEDSVQKYRRFYFRDLHLEILKEKNCHFTTASLVEGGDIIHLPDSERSVDTGVAIRGLLDKCFNSDNLYPVEFDTFDQGATTIYYSSPANYKGKDDLDYLLKSHVSAADSGHERGLLTLDRTTKKFKLTTIKQLFDKSVEGNIPGELYYENFTITQAIDETDSFLESREYAPENISLLASGNIEGFNLDPSPGDYTQHHSITHAVHTYALNKKQFCSGFKYHNIEEVEQVFYDNFVERMPPVKSVGSNQIRTYSIFPTTELKRTNQNIKNVFSTGDDGIQNVNSGRNKALYSALFMGTTIRFNVEGATFRRPGTFCGVVKSDTSKTSYYDSKLLGVYFITNVEHIFEDGKYYNNITAVKTYYGEKLYG